MSNSVDFFSKTRKLFESTPPTASSKYVMRTKAGYVTANNNRSPNIEDAKIYTQKQIANDYLNFYYHAPRNEDEKDAEHSRYNAQKKIIDKQIEFVEVYITPGKSLSIEDLNKLIHK